MKFVKFFGHTVNENESFEAFGVFSDAKSEEDLDAEAKELAMDNAERYVDDYDFGVNSDDFVDEYEYDKAYQKAAMDFIESAVGFWEEITEEEFLENNSGFLMDY